MLEAAGLGAGAGGKGTKVVSSLAARTAVKQSTVRVRHYTTKSRLGKIQQDGTLIADDSNRVFTVNANTKVLSPRDAESKLQIGRGRGAETLEFDARLSEVDIITNPRTGVVEYTFRGNVNLSGRNTVFGRRR